MTKLQHKMKSKIFVSSLFAIILIASLVMAVASITVSPGSLRFTESGAQQVIVTNTDDDSTITVSTPASVTDGTTTLSFSVDPSTFGIIGSNQFPFTVTLNGDPKTLGFGRYTSSLNVTATSSDDSSTSVKNIPVEVFSTFCLAGSVGTLELSNIDINNEGDGDDNEWKLLDIVEIEVEVENNGDEDVDDIILELGIFDSNGNNIADDMNFENADDEEIDFGDLNDDDKDEVIFRFLIPADIEDGNYDIAIKAYSDGDEDVQCIDHSSDLEDDFFESISIDREDDEGRFVIVDNILMDNQVQPGNTVTGTFTVYNIGDEDQERVLVTMINSELGIDQEFEITQDMDQGDDETLSFNFRVPANAESKSYNIEFRTYYDYSRGTYREGSDDTFLGLLQVLGSNTGSGSGSGTGSGGVSITAALGSEAISGEELIVNAVLRNTGSEAATYVIDASGYQSWAELDSISRRIVSLDAGQTSNIDFVFNVNDDASGTEIFTITANSNGRLEVQDVEVNIAGSGSGITGGFTGIGSGSNLIWVIAIVNVILIILIILVAVRLSRRA